MTIEIQKLSVSERIELAEALWDSVYDKDEHIDLSDQQVAELNKRLAAYEIDKAPGSSWSVVKKRILNQ